MNALSKLLLFLIILVTFSSCVFQSRPYKHWYTKRGVRYPHYHRGNNYGGRHMWVHQYKTY